MSDALLARVCVFAAVGIIIHLSAMFDNMWNAEMNAQEAAFWTGNPKESRGR